MIREIIQNLRNTKKNENLIDINVVKNNISKVVAKYKDKRENASNIQEKMLWQRKLEAVKEVAEALNIGKNEVGL